MSTSQAQFSSSIPSPTCTPLMDHSIDTVSSVLPSKLLLLEPVLKKSIGCRQSQTMCKNAKELYMPAINFCLLQKEEILKLEMPLQS
eukprot:3355947-Ditylum_brightwellii.AAC.1